MNTQNMNELFLRDVCVNTWILKNTLMISLSISMLQYHDLYEGYKIIIIILPNLVPIIWCQTWLKYIL